MDWREFAKKMGFRDERELWEKMEKVYSQGDVGWYVLQIPDGRWIAFDDAEIALDRVEYFPTKAKAKRYLEECWKEVIK